MKLASSKDTFRNHSGKVYFRNPVLVEAAGPRVFDGIGVKLNSAVCERIQVRDVAAGSHFTAPENGRALNLSIASEEGQFEDTTYIDIVVKDLTGRDRAITLVYAVPIAREGLTWLDTRRRITCQPGEEYLTNGDRFTWNWQ